MTKLVMTIELDYDDIIMHGDDQEGKDWFFNDILFGEEALILHSNEIGDEIGTVRVIEIL